MTPNQLDADAFHVAFEVAILVDQLEFYIQTHSPVFPSSSSTEPEEQAVLEAVLVHLRLLDEFLGSTGRRFPDDVRACDWPGWSQKPFLSVAMRKRVNAHVAHLSRRRVDGQEWHLAKLGLACCVRLIEFFDSIPPARLPAFLDAPAVSQRGLQRLSAASRSNWSE